MLFVSMLYWDARIGLLNTCITEYVDAIACPVMARLHNVTVANYAVR